MHIFIQTKKFFLFLIPSFSEVIINSFKIKDSDSSCFLVSCLKNEKAVDFWIENKFNDFNNFFHNERTLKFQSYAAKILKKFEKENKIKNLSISCYNKSSIDWIDLYDRNSNINIQKIQTFHLIQYAIRILKIIPILEKLEELYISCYENQFYFNWEKDFLNKTKETRKLILEEYATILLSKTKNFKNLEEIKAVCDEEKSISWLEETETFNIKEIKKLFFFNYASKIFKKASFEHIKEFFFHYSNEIDFVWEEEKRFDNEIKKITLEKNAINLLNKKEDFKELEELVLLFFNNLHLNLAKENLSKINKIKKLVLKCYASKLLENLRNFQKLEELVIDCFENEIFWLGKQEAFFIPIRISLLNIKKLRLYNYATKVIDKIVNPNELKEFSVICQNTYQFNLINNFSLLQNIKTLNLKDYAIEFLEKNENFSKLESISINCSSKRFFYFFKKNFKKIKKTKKIILKEHATKILFELNEEFFKVRKDKEISFVCFKEKNIEWFKEKKKFILKNIKKLSLDGYASKILINIKYLDNIEELVIYCPKEEHVDWLENFYNNMTFKKIKEIKFNEYALKILKKNIIFTENKKLFINHSYKQELNTEFFIQNKKNDMNVFINEIPLIRKKEKQD